jgi:hypothetical protein
MGTKLSYVHRPSRQPDLPFELFISIRWATKRGQRTLAADSEDGWWLGLHTEALENIAREAGTPDG